MTPGASYALITGASRGLGRFFAQAVAARGKNLILVATNQEKLETVASQLRASHSIVAETIKIDLSVPGAGLELAAEIANRGFTVDLIVNNAGFGNRGEFTKLPLERQLQMIHLHNTSVVELTYKLLPEMIRSGRGGIINISSMAGFQPVPYAALYSATKSFLTTFSMALREELRANGVTVVTVCPGRLKADPQDEVSSEKRQKVPGREQGHAEVVSEALKKLDAGGGLVIPGLLNRLTVRSQRLISPNAVPKIVARLSRP